MISNRVISEFVLPFDTSSTPYNNSDFDPEVRELCVQELGTNHLRVAKCIVVGDIAVGKTCLINRFVIMSTQTTIGNDWSRLRCQKFDILKTPFSLQVSHSFIKEFFNIS